MKKTFAVRGRKTVAVLLLSLLMTALLSSVAWGATLGRTQFVVNKSHYLTADYVPASLVALNKYMTAPAGVQMTQAAAEAMGRMVKAAAYDGVTGFNGQSGYRSYGTQTTLYDRKVNYYLGLGYSREKARAQAATVVAPPGASEHQTGLALDITTAENGYGMTESFGTTKVGKWLAANCWKYGFILRYPKDKTSVTGYIYEPWHFRYVGVPHAEYMTKNGLCLEEYLQRLANTGSLEFTTYNGYSYTIVYAQTDISSSLEGVVTCLSMADPQKTGYIFTVRPPLYDLQGHWSEREVRSLVDYGIVKGYPDGTFKPGVNINRGELVSLLDRTWELLLRENSDLQEAMLQLQPPDGEQAEPVTFSDVAPSAYYFKSLMKMYEAGLVASSLVEYGADGTLRFSAATPVLRSQAAESLAPLFEALPEVEASAELLDMYQEDPALREAVQVLVDYGVVKGDNFGNFLPRKSITRAEIAAMLNRVIEFYLSDDADAGDAQ